MVNKTKILLVLLLIWFATLSGCESDVTNRVGVSSGGLIIGLKQFSGNAGLPSDGTSQATIRAEVFTTLGQTVDGASVFLTTTLGTLGEAGGAAGGTNLTIETVNGVGLAFLTSGTQAGTAFVVATVENISATVAVQIVNVTGTTN